MQVLMWQGKYRTVLYDASTNEALEGSALRILRQLVADGWIYEPREESFSEDEREILAYTEEFIDGLPALYAEDARKTQARLCRRLAENEAEKDEYAMLQRLVAGEEVWECFRARTDYDEATWAKIEARFLDKPHFRLQGEDIYRRVSAWAVLENRTGHEYEEYSLEDVVTD